MAIAPPTRIKTTGWSGTSVASGAGVGTLIGSAVGGGGLGGAGFGFGATGGAVPVRGPGPGGAGDWLEDRHA